MRTGVATMDESGWDLAVGAGLLIGLGFWVVAVPEWWSPAGVLAIGVGSGVLAILARRGWRGWS